MALQEAHHRARALNLANEIRMHRAAVKRAVSDEQLGIFDAIDDPLCDRMPVRHVLLALPLFGPSKTDTALRLAGISATARCGALTPRQRASLADVLADRHAQVALRV